MEVEKPHPAAPPILLLWGFRLPLGIYGVRCWGPVHPPPLFQGPGSEWTGYRSARADSCPGTGKRGGAGRRRPPTPPRGPPGIQAETWPAGAGLGKACHQRSSLVFPHPSLSLAPPRSLPPAAARCQHYFPFSSFSSFPTPYPPTPHPPQADLRSGNAFISVLYARL